MTLNSGWECTTLKLTRRPSTNRLEVTLTITSDVKRSSRTTLVTNMPTFMLMTANSTSESLERKEELLKRPKPRNSISTLPWESMTTQCLFKGSLIHSPPVPSLMTTESSSNCFTTTIGHIGTSSTIILRTLSRALLTHTLLNVQPRTFLTKVSTIPTTTRSIPSIDKERLLLFRVMMLKKRSSRRWLIKILDKCTSLTTRLWSLDLQVRSCFSKLLKKRTKMIQQKRTNSGSSTTSLMSEVSFTSSKETNVSKWQLTTRSISIWLIQRRSSQLWKMSCSILWDATKWCSDLKWNTVSLTRPTRKLLLFTEESSSTHLECLSFTTITKDAKVWIWQGATRYLSQELIRSSLSMLTLSRRMVKSLLLS